MDQHHKVTVPLGHRVDVNEAIHYLLHRLDCDSWYVATHREHLYVIHLTKGNVKRYAVCFECTSPADKGIYHGNQASSISILPLGSEPDLAEGAAREIAGLLNLARGAQVEEHHFSPVTPASSSDQTPATDQVLSSRKDLNQHLVQLVW